MRAADNEKTNFLRNEICNSIENYLGINLEKDVEKLYGERTGKQCQEK